MHLFLRRSQRDDGWITSSMMFVMDVRLDLTEEEKHLCEKYDLLSAPVYASDDYMASIEAAKEQAEYAGRPFEKWIWQTGYAEEFIDQASRFWSLLCAYGNEITASLQLHMTLGDLIDGQHVECENLEALLIAEEAIRKACEYLSLYLKAASTYDGREELHEY